LVKELVVPTAVSTGEPVVKLLAYTERPYDLSIASARTCYSPGLRFAADVNDQLRDVLGKAIYEAGHHTPFQHPTFVFGLENVSRHFTWSFLHSHPFYNSEPSSQRYVVLEDARVFVPPLEGEARRVYDEAVLRAWAAYNELEKLLYAPMQKLMASIGRIKNYTEKKANNEAQKKAIETARYVVPIGAFTSMYHTLSGIELQRYWRMVRTGDTPYENRLVVEKMVEEVRKVDPFFFDKVGEGPLPAADVLEARATAPADPDAANRAFDRQLEGRWSKLVAWTPNGEELVAESVREVLGATAAALPDDDAIDLVTNPGTNRHLLETLNAHTHSPLMRALNHPTYTFKKRLSHAGDSQDQRHRTIPGSRPLLSRAHTQRPDYVLPELVAQVPAARKVFEETMDALWESKNRLVQLGVPSEFAVYILPNAVAVRFTQTGSWLNLFHKWKLRTCFNAQREIYNASMDEIAQVARVHPRLMRNTGPPCLVRNGHVEDHPVIGPCSEGDHWCGIKVWNNWPNVKRPF
jgi:flavin-dependent thymidylate synthase